MQQYLCIFTNQGLTNRMTRTDNIIKRAIFCSLLILITSLKVMGLPYCDVRKFSIIDGLAANTISDIAQTPDRLMWFSTWNGISYYDGNSFHTFRDEADDIDLLSTNRFMDIYATSRNNVWCITAGRHLYAYETILCTFVPVGDNINKLYNIDLRVDKIYNIKQGNTWVTTKSGDYLIRIKGLQREGNIPELIKVGQDGLRSGNVWHIWADQKKREWILTDKGTTIYHSQFSTPIPFKWIREVGDNIFLATQDGRLAVFDENNKLNMIPLPAGVTRINQLKNTGYQLLIATNLGMIIYNPRTFKTEIINVQSPSQPLAEVKNIYTDDFDMVWVFTDGMGVTLVNPKTSAKQWLFADQQDPMDRTTSDSFFITQDENKTLWIVPNGGTFSYFDRKAGKLVPYLLRSNSSGNYRVPKIGKHFLSDQGILWIAGTHDLTQVAFKNHTYRLNKLENGEAEVRALCNTPEGYHWTGYANGVVQVTDSKYQTVGYLAPGGQIVPNQVPFCPYPVYSIFSDTRGRMWIGTQGDGLYVRSQEGISHYEHNPANKASLPHNDIYDMVADRHGRIWVATYGGGLALAQEGETGLFFYNRNFGLPWSKNSFANIRRIFCTPTGEILVGTTDGLITFGDNFRNPQQIKFYQTCYIPNDTTSLAANDVNFIIEHSNGKTYISQLGGILESIVTKKLLQDNLKTKYFKNINYNEGIVQSMIEDNEGNLWVIRESSINKCNLKTGKTTVFGPNDFDYNISFTEARPTHDPATNDISVGTPFGWLTFNPATLKKSQYQAHIIFTSLHFTGESESIPILHSKKIVIPANKRNLTISFASLDYSRKYQVKYRYRLEGHTPPGKWIDNGSSNTIGFNRISQGDYILKVSATNSHGVWSKYIAELPIEVRPTFWESVWGRLTLLLLLAAVVASIFYSYNRKQREKLEHEMSLMKNDFFSDASHKLRTPLTLIGGPLQHVLETEHGITRNGREMLVIALKNSREMLNMLNKVLRFDDNANFLVNGGLNENVNEEGNEMEKVEGEIDDTTVSKYLKELEEEKKKEKAKHEEEENQKGTASNKPSKNLTILVVEDNSDLRLYLNSVLEEKYNVLLAENGKVGLYKARTEMPDFILTDVTMPVMDGITMIREIKQDRTISHIPIIILSAKASVEDQLKGFEQGVDGYLTKPFSTSYLIGRIEAAINKRKATQTDIAKMMKQNGKVGYAGKTENSGNAEAAEIFQPATEPRKTLSELNFDIQEKERLAEEKKSELKSYAFMESQINDKTMGRILKYVTDNMGSPDLKIDDIADAIGMSRSVLYNKIKQAVGMTPIDFVRHIRIMRACELLQQTNDPLTSIAFEVGFSDPKYFSKVFKKELGIVPSEYRERTKE